MTAAGHIVAVGHVGLGVRDVDRLSAFYRDTLALRQSAAQPGVIAIFEVGDTDVFLLPGEPATAEFDLATDDVDAPHGGLAAADLECDAPKDDTRSAHRGFSFTDPEGNRVRVVNSHPRNRR